MTKLLIGVVVAVVLACLGLPVLLYAALTGAGPGACHLATTVDSPGADEPTWNAEQLGIAATIVAVGITKTVPRRGWIVALATAMQESGLRNLPHLGDANDHDSIGVFQQRPSQGWGTSQQLADPAYQAGKFYDTLLTIPGWEQLPLTDAAQAVQRSAYPSAYAKWTAPAIALVETVGSTIPGAMAGDLEQCVSITGWTQPVRAPVLSGFRPPERPTHNGVDLAAARGTPIRAAASGTVMTVQCNVDPVSHGCDRDGSPQIGGCGWYLDVQNAGGVVTRYCHLSQRPFVEQGQQVVVGQIVGLVGSSGNSSGPHLHYEVHLNRDPGPAGAVDPVSFMREVGAPLGIE